MIEATLILVAVLVIAATVAYWDYKSSRHH